VLAVFSRSPLVEQRGGPRGIATPRTAQRPVLRCAAGESEFSSIKAWEAEFAALKSAKGVTTSPVEKGSNVLSKALPGFAVIGNAFERAFNKVCRSS
jgi:hypothetical protein